MKNKIFLVLVSVLLFFLAQKIISYGTMNPITIEVHGDYHSSLVNFIRNEKKIKEKIHLEINQDVIILRLKFLQAQSYSTASRDVSDQIIGWAKTRKFKSPLYKFGPVNFHSENVPIYFQIDQMRKISKNYPDNVIISDTFLQQ